MPLGLRGVRLAPGLLSLILTNCREVLPNEACGFLLGANERVLFVAPMENTADDPAHRYRITPAATAAALHRAIRLGVDVIGGFHSHPDGPDMLSGTDAAGSPGPEFVHLLIGRDEAVHAYRVLARSRIVEVPVACR